MVFNQGFTDKTYEIYLNSEFDKSGSDTNSDWTTEFKQISLNPNKGYQISLNSLQIPNTLPQFHDSETSFIIDDGTDTYNINYDNTKIFNNVADMTLYVSGLFSSNISGVVVSQDSSTKKTIITNNSGETLTLNFTNSNSKNFFRKLGFNSDVNIDITNTNSLTSSTYASIIGTSRFYVVCEEISNNSFSGKGYNNWSIFQAINCDVGFGSYCNYEVNNNMYYHDLNTSSNINNLSFRILDDRFRPITLIGGGVQMSLYLREV